MFRIGAARKELILVRNHKTGHERWVPVPAMTWQCLEAYLPKRQNHLEALGRSDESALFVNRYGGRITASAISRGMQKLGQRLFADADHDAPVPAYLRLGPVGSGRRLPDVQQLLGHQTISTTMRYLHVADPQLHQAVKVHPLNEILAVGGAA